MKPLKESSFEKKNKLLNELIVFLEDKSKNDPNNEDHFVIDDSIKKNHMLITIGDEQLLLKVKIKNNNLEITHVKILKKKL